MFRRLESYNMIGWRQFRRALLIPDDELHLQTLGIWKSLEQLDRELFQLSRFHTFKIISGFDVRVVLVLALLVGVTGCRIVRMCVMLVFGQRRGDLDVFYAAACIAIELKKASAVPE